MSRFNTPSVDQIALLDVVKIFLLSFLSDGIIDSVYPALTEALKKCFHPPVPLELLSAVTDLQKTQIDASIMTMRK